MQLPFWMTEFCIVLFAFRCSARKVESFPAEKQLSNECHNKFEVNPARALSSHPLITFLLSSVLLPLLMN